MGAQAGLSFAAQAGFAAAWAGSGRVCWLQLICDPMAAGTQSWASTALRLLLLPSLQPDQQFIQDL